MVQMMGSTIYDFNVIKYTDFNTGAASHTILIYSDMQSINWFKKFFLVFRRMLIVSHHAAAVAAKAYTEEFFCIRYQKGEVIHIYFTGHGNQA
jgi:hypothetical protein